MKIPKSLRSLSFLWFGSLAGSGSTFVIYMILARELGPELFGTFSSAMAITVVFSLLSGFGIPQVWLKLFGEEGFNALRWVGPSLSYVFLTLVFIGLATGGIALLQPNDQLSNQLLFLLLGYVSGYVFVQLVGSKLQLEERFVRLTFWQLLPNLTRLIIIAFLIYLLNYPISVIEVGWVYAGIGLVFTLMGTTELLAFKNGKARLKGHEIQQQLNTPRPTLGEVVRQAWPFGFAGLFAFVYIQSDIIMIKYISGDAEAGYYNVAYTVISAIMTIPIILFSKFLIPKYHRWSNQNIERLLEVSTKGSRLMILAGGAILVGILVLAPILTSLLFGEKYKPSILMLNILSLSIPFTFLAYSYGATLLTSDHMKLKVKLMGSVAVINILLNIFLIGPYGAPGAAVSTVVSNIILALLYRHFSRERVFKNVSV